ncbi:MAG: hypothetical protein F4106_03060 [Gemmatimonadetes bacterium]|nr:hypothetical protein [Gemmatimonadota bacterium]MXX71644.1 hypothetical protein [Gemmatimonadota bacterium]MYJ17019.1 hypothetical protein [Gemmatimonadota bacterium]
MTALRPAQVLLLSRSAFVLALLLATAAAPDAGVLLADSFLDTLRTRTEARTSSSGFYRVCWLPVDLQLQMLVFGEEEAVDRDAIQNALSFTDLHPDRVIVFTIDPESPFRTLDLVTGSR